MLSKRASSVITVVMFLFVLAVLEVVFRFILPVPEFSGFNRINYSQLVGSANQADKKPLQHASYIIASEPDGASFVHNLNLYGFRDRDWKGAKSQRRVLFVGDSFVEGFMAPDGGTIPKGFEQEAARHGERLDVMNMGINAAGFPEYLKLCRDAIPRFKPDDVVLVCYVNDFPPPAFTPDWLSEPGAPKHSARYMPRVIDAVVRMTRGEPVPFAWHAAPFQYFAPIGAPANPWTEKQKDFEAIVDPKLADAMKTGRFNPFMVNEIHWCRRFLTMPFDAREHVANLREYAARHGAKLSVVYVPCRYQLNDYYLQFAEKYSEKDLVSSLKSGEFLQQAGTLGAACAAENVSFLDLTPVLQAKENAGTRLYWDYDSHMRAQGYLLVGSELWRWWNQDQAKKQN